MIVFLVVVPWVLTLFGLLFIMIKTSSKKDEMSEDFFMDDDHDREIVRVAVYEDKAYWVYDNVFYESEVTREPDFTTARPIDTMALDPKELDRLLNILDELEDSENERD